MNKRNCAIWMALTLCSMFLTRTPSFALDQKRINDIRRAETSEKLVELADKMLRDDASRKPKDFEEGTQIAAETVAYLLMIQIKQNSLIMEQNRQLLEELKKKP